MTFFWDSETEPFSAACAAPDIVCIQFCDDTSRPWLMTRDGMVTDGADILEQGPLPEELLANQLERGEMMVGQTVAFDFAVALAAWPQLTPLVWQAYREDRVQDTEIRQKLADIGRSRYRTRLYNLGSLSQIHGGPKLDKRDPWRRRYKLLKHVHLKDWATFETTVPADAQDVKNGIATEVGAPIHLRGRDAIDYALNDAVATRAAYLGQEARYDPALLVDGASQARKFWALQLASVWGIRTSARGVASLREGVEARIEELRGLLVDSGLLRPNGTRDTKAAKEHMRRVCEELGLPLAMTDGGDVSLSNDVCDATQDVLLKTYAEYSSLKKTLSNDVKAWEQGIVLPCHPHFDLADTGRITASKPNSTNPRRMPGVRECIVPRDFDPKWYAILDAQKKAS